MRRRPTTGRHRQHHAYVSLDRHDGGHHRHSGCNRRLVRPGRRPGAQPPVRRTLASRTAVERTCHTALRRHSRGVAVSSWTAPASGFLDVRSFGGKRSDWDLALFDARTRRALASSEAFGSHEVAQTWVSGGRTVAIQGCRRSGRAARLPIRIQYLAVQRPASGGTPSLVSVPVSGAADLIRLDRLGVDVTEDVQKGRAIVRLNGASQLELLKQSGFRFTTVVADMNKAYLAARAADRRYTAAVDSSPLPSGRTEYRILADYEAELKQIVDDSTRASRARSSCPRTRSRAAPIQGVEISRDVDAKDDGKPTYFVMGDAPRA